MLVQLFRRCNYKTLFTVCCVCVAGQGFGFEESDQTKKVPSKEEVMSPQSIKRLSEAYGHYMQKTLESPFISLDCDTVIKGMKDAKAGKPSPMNDQEFEEMIGLVQEYSYQEVAARNLKEADDFLKKNAKSSGVVELEPGKLQYIVLQKGTGEEVTDANVPVISYKGKYLNEEVFANSDDSGGPIALPLNQTIPGFRKGILGMKQGEKRRLFIHPDLGYGTSGQLLPNTLLIFDIEVTDVKPADATETADQNASAEDLAVMTYGSTQSPGDEAQEGEDDEDDDNSNGR